MIFGSGGGGGSSSGLGSLITPAPAWYYRIVQLFAGVDIFCIVFIFLRKKWAFYGSAGSAFAVFLVSILVNHTMDGLTALILPAVLYGVLQIGGENSGWKQLK